MYWHATGDTEAMQVGTILHITGATSDELPASEITEGDQMSIRFVSGDALGAVVNSANQQAVEIGCDGADWHMTPHRETDPAVVSQNDHSTVQHWVLRRQVF